MSEPIKAHPQPSPAESRVGVAYGLAAYLFWGMVVIYFKAVAHVPALEVLSHRVVWSVVLLGLLMRARGRWGEALAALRHGPTRLTLLATTTLIAGNWFVFIWAVANDQVLQASLGYYINPLLNVLLGFVFLRERLRPVQWLSVALATLGVTLLTVNMGQLPWVALFLASSFGLYGLLRKTVGVDALVGLSTETTLLLPVALVYLAVLYRGGDMSFGHVSRSTDVLLVLGGVVTAMPLLWFAHAARRLRLATVGFLQYIAPSMQFLLAVVVYHEPFTRSSLVTFICIWAALALYSVDTLRANRARVA